MKKHETAWGGGCTDLYLNIEGGKPEILDYEIDTERLHEMCGGRCYYRSRSGASGAGFFEDLGELIPIGAWRIDTAHNEFQWFLPVGKTRDDNHEKVYVAVPYSRHDGVSADDRRETLLDHPTVIKSGNKVVYCNFFDNFVEVLQTLLSGETLPEKCVIRDVTFGLHGYRTIRRTFTDASGRSEEVVLEFYDLCSMHNNVPNPLEFARERLSEFQAPLWGERMFDLLGVERLESGTFVRTIKVDGAKYRGEVLPGNPLETGNLTAGWKRRASDVLVRYYNKSSEVHIVAYAEAAEAYDKQARRLAARLGENEEFISFVSTHEGGRYVEYETVVPKTLFVLNEAKHLAEVRRGLARKVREDVTRRARQWIDDVNDQSILEAIPDDLVVTVTDSTDAGNCLPGTEAFIAQYFPGRTEGTAGELKEYANNYHVMRIFRHLAATGRFDWKARQLG